ncbi:uncharacterized protein LOC117644734 [Thrips palmi]|uniref:Uncharacterized protein LOC117644734 n=1 Tax=Thrips palmi TaxID=161013 RepID=A0A6P8YK39_THRPL|nr:uncharacterized protein LOC117644734 [Thrips palmi]
MGHAVQEQLQQQADNLLQPPQQQQQAELQNQNVHHPKFPITNGSLFTSLDGHIPIVHNYRRRRDMQMGTTYVPVHSNQPVIVHNGGFFRAQGPSVPDEGTLHSPPLPHQHFAAPTIGSVVICMSVHQ